jgi:hypothetical protein
MRRERRFVSLWNSRTRMNRSPESQPPANVPVGSRLSEALASGVDRVFAQRAAEHSGTSAVDGFDGSVDEPIARLLSLLDAPALDRDPSLIDATMARILRASEPGEPILGRLDDEALDAWMLHAQAVESVPASLRPRAAAIASLGALVRDGEPIHDPRRVDRVLAAIDRAESERALRFSEPVQTASRGSSWRWRELVSIAAMVLIGVGVLLPMMGGLRARTLQSACLSNLHAIGQGVSSYAMSNRNAMPMVTAGFSGQSWWDVGVPERSNSANLFTLVTNRYVRLSDLACPGKPIRPAQRALARRPRLAEPAGSLVQLPDHPQGSTHRPRRIRSRCIGRSLADCARGRRESLGRPAVEFPKPYRPGAAPSAGRWIGALARDARAGDRRQHLAPAPD